MLTCVLCRQALCAAISRPWNTARTETAAPEKYALQFSDAVRARECGGAGGRRLAQFFPDGRAISTADTAIDGVRDLQDSRTLAVIASERLLIQSTGSDDERLMQAGS